MAGPIVGILHCDGYGGLVMGHRWRHATKALVVQKVRAGFTLEMAARIAGVSASTVRRWRMIDRRFAAKLSLAGRTDVQAADLSAATAAETERARRREIDDSVRFAHRDPTR